MTAKLLRACWLAAAGAQSRILRGACVGRRICSIRILQDVFSARMANCERQGRAQEGNDAPSTAVASTPKEDFSVAERCRDSWVPSCDVGCSELRRALRRQHPTAAEMRRRCVRTSQIIHLSAEAIDRATEPENIRSGGHRRGVVTREKQIPRTTTSRRSGCRTIRAARAWSR
jgi:hypothetical protein